MSRYQLVIFDCDSVLVDSERITNQAFAYLLGELRLAFTLEDLFEHFVGHSMAQCLDKISAVAVLRRRLTQLARTHRSPRASPK